jgi:hypothetical protein
MQSAFPLENYVGIIKTAAAKAKYCFNLDFQDSLQDGYLIYLKCLESYNKSCGTKFSTYLWNQLKPIYSATSHSFLNTKLKLVTIISDDLAYSENGYSYVELMDMIERNLSEDARKVLSVIFFEGQKISMLKVQTILATKEGGWYYRRINEAWKEIKNFWKSYNSVCFSL